MSGEVDILRRQNTDSPIGSAPVDAPIDKGTSMNFAKMSFICACMIVYLHTGCAADGEVIGRWCNEFIASVCRIAIPWFFFAAGFFLARHTREKGWWGRELKKRFHTLVIPFWIWGTIICLFYGTIGLIVKYVGYDYHGVDATRWFSVNGIMRVIGLDVTANMPTMWFLRTLFIFVALSPLIVAGCRKFLGIVFVLYVLFVVCRNYLPTVCCYFFEYLLSLRGLVYFSAGIVFLGCRRKMALPLFVKHIVCIGGLGLLCCKVFVETLDIYGVIDIAMVPVVMMLVFGVVKHIKLPQVFVTCSFPMYVVHVMIAYLISAVYGVIGIGGEGKTLFVLGLLRFSLTIALAITTTLVMRMSLPRFSRVAFGGR